MILYSFGCDDLKNSVTFFLFLTFSSFLQKSIFFTFFFDIDFSKLVTVIIMIVFNAKTQNWQRMHQETQQKYFTFVKSPKGELNIKASPWLIASVSNWQSWLWCFNRGIRFAVNNCWKYAMVFFEYQLAQNNSTNVGLVACASDVYTNLL